MENPYRPPESSPVKVTDEKLPLVVILLCWLVVGLAFAYPFVRRTPLFGSLTLSGFELYFPTLGILGYAGFMFMLWKTYRRQEVFIARFGNISGQTALEAFKDIARDNMKMVFPALVLQLLALVAAKIILGSHTMTGTVVVFAALAFQIWFSRKARKTEFAIRALPAATSELDAQHKDISERWKRQLWPDF